MERIAASLAALLICGCGRVAISGSAGSGSEGEATGADEETTTTTDGGETTDDSGSSEDDETGPPPPDLPEQDCPALDGPPGSIRLLADAQGDVFEVALDEVHLYWTSDDQGTVNRVDHCTGEIETVSEGHTGPHAVALDDTHVYWANQNAAGEVLRASKDGGPSQVLVDFEWGQPAQITVDDERVYITEVIGDRLLAVPKTGGELEILLPTSDANVGPGLAMDESFLYVAGQDGTIKLSKTLDEFDYFEHGWPGDLFVHEGRLFRSDWPAYMMGHVYSTDLEGNDEIELVGDQYLPGHVAADAEHVYWSEQGFDPGEGAIRKIPREGGEVVTLAQQLDRPQGLVVGPQFVFWGQFGDGRIVATEK